MLPKRRCETVMAAHHVEALDERLAMVFRRQTAVEIIHHDHSDVFQRQVFLFASVVLICFLIYLSSFLFYLLASNLFFS